MSVHHLLATELFAPPPTCRQCGKPMFSGLLPPDLCNACDRELLALAAKAAGKTRAHWDIGYLRALGHAVSQDMMWDPRRDSGQTLEMAIYLGITVDRDEYNGVVYIQATPPGSRQSFDEPCGDDPVGAARQAVFRAAVEIGRAMP